MRVSQGCARCAVAGFASSRHARAGPTRAIARSIDLALITKHFKARERSPDTLKSPAPPPFHQNLCSASPCSSIYLAKCWHQTVDAKDRGNIAPCMRLARKLK